MSHPTAEAVAAADKPHRSAVVATIAAHDGPTTHLAAASILHEPSKHPDDVGVLEVDDAGGLGAELSSVARVCLTERWRCLTATWQSR